MQSKYRWKIHPRVSEDLINQILYNRGIITSAEPLPQELTAFFYPDPKKHLFDPFKLSDLKKACQRIIQASKKKESVGIFSDYDADGIPGAAFLYEAFLKLGLKSLVYIPSRSEGYGFSEQAVRFFHQKKVKLIVIVDAGTRDFKALLLAKKLRLDTIVCDHHEPSLRLPPAFALINPKKKNEKYPFKELSGAGVAFKLVQGISQLDKRIDNDFLRWSLDLMAISVVFDMVPLISENRILAKLGLLVLRKTKRLGLKKLIEYCSLQPDKIKSYDLGFIIGPRINAPGRIYNPRTSFDLLITKNEKQAEELAGILDGVNRERQKETEKYFFEAMEQIKKKKLDKLKIILVQDEEWPSGLIGLIASKLKGQFNRPVFVLQRGKRTSRGSARSIDGFHLVRVLSQVKDLIIRGGGHAKAAGLTLESEKIEMFYEQLLKLAEKRIKDQDLIPELEIDALVSFKDLTWDLWQKVEELEPFGMGNPKPLFLTTGAKIVDFQTMGNQKKHLSLFLEQQGQIMRAVYFNGGEYLTKFKRGGQIDLVYSLSLNDFSARPKIELKIEDLK